MVYRRIKMSQDEYMEKVNRQRRKEQMEKERQQAIKDRAKFEELKSRYFGLAITDGEIEIHSIDSIDDYYEIGERNHICCGTSKYFLNAVTDEQKSIRVHDFNRRISKNSKEICESLGIQCVTPPICPQFLHFSFGTSRRYDRLHRLCCRICHIVGISTTRRLHIKCNTRYDAGFQ